MKEKIFEFFAKQGFQLEEVSEGYYSFDYEAHKLLCILNEHVESFVSIAALHIAEIDEYNPLLYYKAMSKFNYDAMYVKAHEWLGGVAIAYEHDMDENEDLDVKLGKMIYTLDFEIHHFKKLLKKMQDEEEEEDNNSLDWDEDSEEIFGEDFESIFEEELSEEGDDIFDEALDNDNEGPEDDDFCEVVPDFDTLDPEDFGEPREDEKENKNAG